MISEHPEDLLIEPCDEETTIHATDEQPETVTQEEYAEIVKKQILDCKTEFNPMTEDEIIDLFADVKGLGSGLVPLEKFDFREYTAEFYRKKFPHFPLDFYTLMEKASNEKLANYAKKDIFPEEKRGGMIRVNEEHVISFGGTGVDSDELEEPDLSDLDHMSLHPSDDLRPPELVRSENTV